MPTKNRPYGPFLPASQDIRPLMPFAAVPLEGDTAQTALDPPDGDQKPQLAYDLQLQRLSISLPFCLFCLGAGRDCGGPPPDP